jgi:hypothetical protein
MYVYYLGQVDPVTILWIFYFQNIFIGIQYFIRMMMLKESAGEINFQNGKPVVVTPKVKRSTAFFFALHYGAFHFAYFTFLIVITVQISRYCFDCTYFNFYFKASMLCFAANTILSLISQVKQDREEKPTISSMMFIPYLRIIPMHLFLIFGLRQQIQSGSTNFGLPYIDAFTLFLLLKTVSDVLFYIITNKTWKAERPRVLGGIV